MFNKLCKTLARQIIRIPIVNRRVQEYRIKREAERIAKNIKQHHLRWELIISGMTMRDTETDKPTVHVDYMPQTAGQGGVVPIFIDSTNWGGM